MEPVIQLLLSVALSINSLEKCLQTIPSLLQTIKVVNNIIYAVYVFFGFSFIYLYRRSFKRMKRHAEV